MSSTEVGERLPTAHILLPALKLKEPGWRWQWAPGLRTHKEWKEGPCVSLPTQTKMVFQRDSGQVCLPSSGSHRPQPATSYSVTGHQTRVIDSFSPPASPLGAAVSPGAASYNLKHFITGQFGFPAHFKWRCWGSATLSSPHWSILTVTFTAFPCYSARPGTGYKLPHSLVIIPKEML